MKFAAHLRFICLVAAFHAGVVAFADDQFPPKMLTDIECLKQHGLKQGTVTDVLQGSAHFAPYFRETSIGARVPLIKFNKDFVEGRLPKSPSIIKECNPNLTIQRSIP